MRISVKEAKSHIGQEVSLYLTLDILRDQKHLQFILAHDHSGQIQLVISKSIVEAHVGISQLLAGSTFRATGKLVEAIQSKTQGLELQVSSVEIYSKAQVSPIGEESGIDLRFRYRVVDLKTRRSQLLMKLRSAFEFACREFTLGKEFTEIHTPKLMGGASESGSQVFKVEYFETTAFLAQSPQFYKQMAIASGLKGVFEIGPVFRAEQSRSTRHMTEFTGLDVEMSWVFDVSEVMKFEEEMLCYAFSKLEKFSGEVEELFGTVLTTQPSVKYMTLGEAKEILSSRGLEFSSEDDLTDECERLLYEILGIDLIFITEYPIAVRPFYHQYEIGGKTTKSFDLIFKGIEITTGALREHSYDVLCTQAESKGVSLESIDHYLDSFRYGCPPHGGFGLGIERVITRLLGLSSVKEAAFVARDPDRLTP